MRKALGLVRRLRMSPERAQEFVAGLKLVTFEEPINPEPTPLKSSQCVTGFEASVRYVLYAIWLSVGDDYFAELSGTYAGDVLERMRAHYKRRQELERIARERRQELERIEEEID